MLDMITIKLHHPLRDLLHEVAAKHEVSMLEVLSDLREARLCRCRFEFWYRAMAETKASVMDIGRISNRDHKTIANGVARYANRYELPLPRGSKNDRYRHYRKRMMPVRDLRQHYVEMAVELRSDVLRLKRRAVENKQTAEQLALMEKEMATLQSACDLYNGWFRELPTR